MEQSKFKRFKRINNLRTTILYIVILIAISTTCLSCNAKSNVKTIDEPDAIEMIDTSNESNYESNIAKIEVEDINKDSIMKELEISVHRYINNYAPKSNKFIPKYLVQYGLEHNIDICFMMAQSQIETCYGTAGVGKESSKRSIFGIMSKRYPSYSESISHYCEVLKKYYLVKGKTEQHLMNRFTTPKGTRYAKNMQYERKLRTAYNHIKHNTNISELQTELMKM